MKLASVAAMRALEQGAVDAGATWDGLMEAAGRGVADAALRLRPRHAIVLVGPGNNGGDGLVVARHLHDAGVRVELAFWNRPALDANRQSCRDRGIAEHPASPATLAPLLRDADLAVDALLGMGASRPVESELAAIIGVVNAARPACRVLAIDLPSGTHADTGRILNTAIRADLTIATGLIKVGLLLYPARSTAGTLQIAPIGLSPEQLEDVMTEQIDAARVRAVLPARPDDSHKGTYGKAMVVAGSLLYPGAASLATAAALRVGAGLVTLATARSALGGPGRLPEITLRPLPEADWGTLGPEAAPELRKHLDGYTALLIGPGLGHEDPTKAFMEALLGAEPQKQRGSMGFRVGAADEKKDEAPAQAQLPPLVIDADGLNILSAIENWHERLPRGQAVLTPHPGEMKRLLGADELAEDRVAQVREAAERWGQVVVLKGATTIVAGPDGQVAIHDGANPALATAGTGDVLAGAIAGLLAQGVAPFDAALAGVYLHGAAGALVRSDIGDAGAIASDLLPRLPLAIARLKAED